MKYLKFKGGLINVDNIDMLVPYDPEDQCEGCYGYFQSNSNAISLSKDEFMEIRQALELL